MYLIDVIPGGDVGVAIIVTVILVKFLLLPLSVKAAKTQVVMRELDPKLKALKETYKDDKEAQAREIMAAYKDAGLNPFASIFLVFLQIPIVIALYYSVARGGGVPLPEINTAILYSFVTVPSVVSMLFLGVVDIAAKSLPLALLAGVSQYFQARFAMPPLPPRDKDAKPDFKTDLQHSMHLQMRYMLPVIIFFAAYSFNASIALYFVVSNIFAIAQEQYVKKHRENS